MSLLFWILQTSHCTPCIYVSNILRPTNKEHYTLYTVYCLYVSINSEICKQGTVHPVYMTLSFWKLQTSYCTPCKYVSIITPCIHIYLIFWELQTRYISPCIYFSNILRTDIMVHYTLYICLYYFENCKQGTVQPVYMSLLFWDLKTSVGTVHPVL